MRLFIYITSLVIIILSLLIHPIHKELNHSFSINWKEVGEVSFYKDVYKYNFKVIDKNFLNQEVNNNYIFKDLNPKDIPNIWILSGYNKPVKINLLKGIIEQLNKLEFQNFLTIRSNLYADLGLKLNENMDFRIEIKNKKGEILTDLTFGKQILLNKRYFWDKNSYDTYAYDNQQKTTLFFKSQDLILNDINNLLGHTSINSLNPLEIEKIAVYKIKNRLQESKPLLEIDNFSYQKQQPYYLNIDKDLTLYYQTTDLIRNSNNLLKTILIFPFFNNVIERRLVSNNKLPILSIQIHFLNNQRGSIVVWQDLDNNSFYYSLSRFMLYKYGYLDDNEINLLTGKKIDYFTNDERWLISLNALAKESYFFIYNDDVLSYISPQKGF